MANGVLVLNNAAILINSVDLSSRARKCKVTFSQETKETTAFGNSARTWIGGLQVPVVEVEFYLDRASGSSVQTLRALLSVNSTGFPINLRAANSAATTSNEVYTMNAVIDGNFDAINGDVGAVELSTVKFKCASTAGITVSTTS